MPGQPLERTAVGGPVGTVVGSVLGLGIGAFGGMLGGHEAARLPASHRHTIRRRHTYGGIFPGPPAAIIGAVTGGALTGGAIGSTVGAALGGPIGAGFGGAFGVIAGGAGAGFTAAAHIHPATLAVQEAAWAF